MKQYVVALLWICPLTLLFYLSDVDLRHIVMEIPGYFRHLVETFFS
jgi:hypothetical protein